MKPLFVKYKSVLWFLLVFIGGYLFLSVLYGYYLDYWQEYFEGVDPITHRVASDSEMLLKDLGCNVRLEKYSQRQGILLFVGQEPVLEIVEGCNSISVIILFIAFVLAFRQGWRKTGAFLLAGTILIYAVNLIRIAILAISLSKYPEYQDFLHRIIFPGIIYGMVFMLWVFWIRTLPKPVTS